MSDKIQAITDEIAEMSVDELNEALAAVNMNWAEVTDTDPERVDPPSETEVQLVRAYLTALGRKLVEFTEFMDANPGKTIFD